MVLMTAIVTIALCLKTDKGLDFVSVQLPMFTSNGGASVLKTLKRLKEDGAIKGKISHVNYDQNSSIKYWVGVY